MSAFDLSGLKDAFLKKVEEIAPVKIKEKAKRFVELIVYDAKVECVDVSQLMFTVERSGEMRWVIKLLMGALTDEQSQYVKDHYYHNGLTRLGWC